MLQQRQRERKDVKCKELTVHLKQEMHQMQAAQHQRMDTETAAAAGADIATAFQDILSRAVTTVPAKSVVPDAQPQSPIITAAEAQSAVATVKTKYLGAIVQGAQGLGTITSIRSSRGRTKTKDVSKRQRKTRTQSEIPKRAAATEEGTGDVLVTNAFNVSSRFKDVYLTYSFRNK